MFPRLTDVLCHFLNTRSVIKETACLPVLPEFWSTLLQSAMKKTWIITCTPILRCVCVCVHVQDHHMMISKAGISDCLNSAEITGGFVCLCVCLGPARAWLGLRAQNTVQTHGEKKKKKKKGWLSTSQTRTLSRLDQKHRARLFRGGKKISERIRAESSRNHKTCFMLATVREKLQRFGEVVAEMNGGR